MTHIRRIRIVLPARLKAQAPETARRIGEAIGQTAAKTGTAPARISVTGAGRDAAGLARAVARTAGDGS